MLILIFLFFPIITLYSNPLQLVFEPSISSISIEGESSIGKWQANSNNIYFSRKIYVIISKEDNEETTLKKLCEKLNNIIIKIPVYSLKSGNPIRDNDLYISLNANSYPYIIYYIEKIKILSQKDINNFLLKTTGFLFLKGQIMYKEIIFNTTINNKMIQLNGNIQTTFTDLKLTPPTKLGGLIKVNNNIKINLSLTFLSK